MSKEDVCIWNLYNKNLHPNGQNGHGNINSMVLIWLFQQIFWIITNRLLYAEYLQADKTKLQKKKKNQNKIMGVEGSHSISLRELTKTAVKAESNQ